MYTASAWLWVEVAKNQTHNKLFCCPQWYRYFIRTQIIIKNQTTLFHAGVLWGPFAGEKADKDALNNLRTERRQKIEELKEKSNYYVMQQLIQVPPSP